MLVLDLVDILTDAATEPTLLAFEDLHWADDLSLEVLASLARRLPDVPLWWWRRCAPRTRRRAPASASGGRAC